MRSRLFVAGGVAVAAALAVTVPASGASSPAPPSSCAAERVDGTYRISWTGSELGPQATVFRVDEQGFRKPWIKVSGSLRSAVWTAPIRDTEDIRFTVRAINRSGASTRCVTAPVGESVPTSTDSTGSQDATGSTDSTGSQDATGSTDSTVARLLPYSQDSFFKSSVDGAPLDTARTKAFHTFMAKHPDQGGKGITWPKVNVSKDWAMSYHVHERGDKAPVWRLTGGNTGNSKLKILTTQGFHMDDAVADSFPTGDQDRPGVMVDYEFGYTVQFADAVPNKATRTIDVSNAAIMWHGSNGLDYRNPKSDDPRNFTSRGRILDAMIIRRDVLEQAIADGTGLGHVLHLFFVETNSAEGFVHPMVGDESSKAGWGAEGERIRIDPAIDLRARGLTGACLAVARTLQENGGYIGDNSGSSTQIKASQGQRYSGLNLTTDCMKGKVSWDDFQVVQKGWAR